MLAAGWPPRLFTYKGTTSCVDESSLVARPGIDMAVCIAFVKATVSSRAETKLQISEVLLLSWRGSCQHLGLFLLK